MPSDDDAERLKLILRAFKFCEQDPTFEAIAEQFYRETKRKLSRDDYERAIKRGV